MRDRSTTPWTAHTAPTEISKAQKKTGFFPQSLILCLGLMAGFSLCSCHHEGGHEEGEELSDLILTNPIRKDTVVTRDYVCLIRSNRNIEIRALEHGYLQTVNIKEGQHVEQGDLMFKILPLVYQATLKSAQAEAQVSRVEYQNTQRLSENQVVSDKELTMAKARLERAMAEVNLAQTHLGFTEIKAPFSGLTDRLRLRKGSLVNEGDLLTTLSDNSTMWVYFNVPEAEYLEYASGDQPEEVKHVQLVMANGQIFNHDGRVNVIEAEFNNKTGTIPFRADFPNPEGLLRHLETGSIRMKRTIKNALLVPQKATYQNMSRHYVFVVDKQDIIRRKEVEIVEELEDLFIIRDGVSPEDRIIFEGLRQAEDGMKAWEYEFEKPEEAYAHLKLKAQ